MAPAKTKSVEDELAGLFTSANTGPAGSSGAQGSSLPFQPQLLDFSGPSNGSAPFGGAQSTCLSILFLHLVLGGVVFGWGGRGSRLGFSSVDLLVLFESSLHAT